MGEGTIQDAEWLLRNAWRMGHLTWKLYPHQKILYDAFLASKARKYVFHCSRRIGKSTTLLTLANALALSHKQATIRYCAAQQKDVREIIHPLMRLLTDDCPEVFKPVWRESLGKYLYPSTGSELVCTGLDEGRADNARGTKMDFGIIDEAGFVTDLDYVLKSVLMPQTLTTNGRIIMASTSPISPAHPFVPFLEEAKHEGAYIKQTIYEDSRKEVLSRIPEWQKEAGGANSTTWRREYLCEIITDQESALVPEFNDQRAERLIRPWDRPPFAHRYVAMDLGLIDFTAILFGYYDFRHAKIVIEDELLMNRKDSKQIADSIKAKEKELWGEQKPYLRVADGNALTIHDFNVLHGLSFLSADNTELEAGVNALRLEVQAENLILHPKCTHLVQHLKYGVWDKAHKKFDRSSAHGHFDLVAALMYFVRHIQKRANPYPENYGLTDYTHYMPLEKKKSEAAKRLEGAFNQNFLNRTMRGD